MEAWHEPRRTDTAPRSELWCLCRVSIADYRGTREPVPANDQQRGGITRSAQRARKYYPAVLSFVNGIAVIYKAVTGIYSYYAAAWRSGRRTVDLCNVYTARKTPLIRLSDNKSAPRIAALRRLKVKLLFVR
jgi:hypothetical protein